jgi:2-C-methyl-D-erythritol 4-phosphate cytidylyltransferase
MQNSTSVIILAGGSSTRMGTDTPKQFIRIAGKPVLVHSYDALRKHIPHATFVIVAPIDHLDIVKVLFSNEINCIVVPGGSSRQGSTLQGLKALAPLKPINVLIHDAARPFVSGQIIFEVLQALEKHEAVDVAISSVDTIIVQRDGFIQNIPKRKDLMRGQTPQAFRFDVLMRCFDEVGEERLSQYTDECGIYLDCNPMGRVRIVQGDEENIKITNSIDLVLADEMFRLRGSDVRSVQPGIDVRGKRTLIFGGTSGIGKAMADIMSNAGAPVISRSRSNGCDISIEKDVQNAIRDAEKTLGGLDVIVNAAGFLRKGPIATQSTQDISEQININLLGAFWIAKWGHSPLKVSKGTFLQFASSSYTRGRSDYVAYSATKAAIVNMTQGLCEEWAADGIRVNCIVPSRTDTEMRRYNFVNEPQSSLCNPYEVAIASTKLLSLNSSGSILRI